MTVNPAISTAQAVAYAVAQQKRHSDELGFLPRQSIEQYAARGQLIISHENEDPASYAIYFTGRNGNRPRVDPYTLRIHQICTQYDARRITHATRLINRIMDVGYAQQFHSIRAWVADDIPANDFWKAVGFTIVGTRKGGRRRNRRHNLWTFDLMPTLFTQHTGHPPLQALD